MLFTANKTFFVKSLGHRYTKGNPYKLDVPDDDERLKKIVQGWVDTGKITVTGE